MNKPKEIIEEVYRKEGEIYLTKENLKDSEILKLIYSPFFHSLEIEAESEHSYYGNDCHSIVETVIKHSRLETKEEVDLRIKTTLKRRIAAKKAAETRSKNIQRQEKMLLKRLKKKYE